MEGPRGITDRVRTTAAHWLPPKVGRTASSSGGCGGGRSVRALSSGGSEGGARARVIVNWVTTPPTPGSGGHTTLFRIVRYLEAHGYQNRVYFYDVYRGDHRYYESIVRRYYDFHGSVSNVDEGMADAHIVVATAWPTAYAVFNSRCAGQALLLCAGLRTVLLSRRHHELAG